MIYLNNSATSYPKPKEVIDSVNECIQAPPLEEKRTGYIDKNKVSVQEARKRIASFFNIENENKLIFTSGATESINLIISGLDLSGKHVITTNTEHNSVLRPLKNLEKNKEIELTIIECDAQGGIDITRLEAEFREHTALLVINHGSNVTGRIHHVKQLIELCHKYNSLVLLDASQSAGLIKIDVADLNPDFMVFAGHKYLYGLRGVGGCYIKENIVQPLKTGGTGVKSELLYQPQELPLLYEAGTMNIPGIFSLYAGIEFIENIGIENIKKQVDSHIEQLNTSFKKLRNVIVYGHWISEDYLPIISFNIKNKSPEEVGYILEQSFNIIVRSGLHCAPLIHHSLGTYPSGNIRISPSYFNSKEDIDKVIEVIDLISEKL